MTNHNAHVDLHERTLALASGPDSPVALTPWWRLLCGTQQAEYWATC